MTARFRIEHALVMDTDHLPGGGGYAVTGMSPGLSEGERIFVSDHFGISDFLHDPGNERDVYFSVERVPGGRTAFTVRFKNGTRRGGSQNRLFVHTLFLDDELLAALHGLPWLLYDQPLRLNGRDLYLTNDVAPLLDAGFPALEWSNSIPDGEAFANLRDRYTQFSQRFAQSGASGGISGFDAVAAVLEAVRSGRRAVLPQGMLFEQLSLLAWSMLPPADRLSLPWTQHDSRAAASSLGVANAERPEGAFVDLRVRASEAIRRVVEYNTHDAESWRNLHAATGAHGISLRSGDLEWWLRWCDSLEDLLAHPLAPDEELIPKLERVAQSVRAGHREPWVNEMEVLRFLLALINRSMEAGQPREIAVQRWNGLFHRTNIAEVVFRRPPPVEWLDQSETRIGAALVAECFMAGSEQLRAGADTRARVAEWLLEGDRLKRVPVATAGRLLERLATDRSALLRPMIESTLRLPRALRELAAVLPEKKQELGPTFIDVIVSATRAGNEDAGWFAEQKLLPQLAANADLANRLSVDEAMTVGEALRGQPATYAHFAAGMRPEVMAALVGQVEAWLAASRKAGLPLARQMLELVNRGALSGVVVERLAFAAAEAGEPSRLWLPAAIDVAKEIDAKASPVIREAFIERVRRLAPRTTTEEKVAVRQMAAALRQAAGERQRARTCMLALVAFTRPSWSSAAPALSSALQIAIASGFARADEWCEVVADLVALQIRNRTLSSTAATLLLAFWERLAPHDFGVALPDALIEGIAFLDGEKASRLVGRWLPQVRRLKELPGAERFLDLLGVIASDEEYALLETERAWRELEHGSADASTFCRLESAQFIARKVGCDTAAAMKYVLEKMQRQEDRAAWLVRTAAAPVTHPVTRRVIESKYLPVALRRLDEPAWQSFLTESGDELFAHSYILLMTARELALSQKSPALVQELQRVCRARGREDAVRTLTEPAPRGLAEQMSVWGGDLRS